MHCDMSIKLPSLGLGLLALVLRTGPGVYRCKHPLFSINVYACRMHAILQQNEIRFRQDSTRQLSKPNTTEKHTQQRWETHTLDIGGLSKIRVQRRTPSQRRKDWFCTLLQLFSKTNTWKTHEKREAWLFKGQEGWVRFSGRLS